MSRQVEKNLKQILTPKIEGVTPGFCVQAYLNGRKKVDLRIGETYPYYDWASLTKVVFTVSVVMRLFDQDKLKVTDSVQDFLPWFPSQKINSKNSAIRIKDLLTHTAGLTWWRPYYKNIPRQLGLEKRWQFIERSVARTEKPVVSKKAVYSDLDFLVLGRLLEEVGQASLEELWLRQQERLHLKQVHFHKFNRPKYVRAKYAPTEKCPWRKKILRGEVHDDNAWALGGIAPHAGLFGPIDSLSQWGLELRKGMRGQKNNLAQADTIGQFTKRAIPRKRGDWALGFMLPSLKNPSAGSCFSLKSVGHTGFVGTSLWYDPQKDLLITVLSNRVHPTRKNSQFVQLRPEIHNRIVEELNL